MSRWFDLFSVWGYVNPNGLGIDLNVTFLSIGDRAFFAFTIECGVLEEFDFCYFRYRK